MRPREVDPGLCRNCEHARSIRSAKGSVFWRCSLSDTVAGWPKYPPLPVRRCPRHQPKSDAGS